MPTAAGFKLEDYPPQMVPFVEGFLDQYDYNEKAVRVSPHLLWQLVCVALIGCRFKQPCEYKRVSELPEQQIDMLIKCLGHRIGVWDLHIFYGFTVKRERLRRKVAALRVVAQTPTDPTAP